MKNSKMIYERKALISKRFNRAFRLLIFFIFHSFIFHSFTSCDKYDTFTTDRSATLQFSSTEVVFDTLITTIPSATQTLTVYNRGDKGLRIRQVRLVGGAGSPFRVNIDGQDLSRTADNSATDFEVRRRDSIMVRAEVTVSEFGNDDCHEVGDELIFTLESGVEQHVALRTVGQDAFYLDRRTLAQDTTLTARRPILVRGELSVAEGVTVTMEAGTRLLFHDDAFMTVHGRNELAELLGSHWDQKFLMIDQEHRTLDMPNDTADVIFNFNRGLVPPHLLAEKDRGRSGCFPPADWDASTIKGTPHSWQTAPISSMGFRAPVTFEA